MAKTLTDGHSANNPRVNTGYPPERTPLDEKRATQTYSERDEDMKRMQLTNMKNETMN